MPGRRTEPAAFTRAVVVAVSDRRLLPPGPHERGSLMRRLTRIRCRRGIIAGLLCALSLPVPAGTDLPVCRKRDDNESIERLFTRAQPSPGELLARLVYAEALSTGFPDDPVVHQAIAWGVMNRVRLAERFPQMRKRYGAGIAGVIFSKAQFNPAVSPRSPHSRDFLCPRDQKRWQLAGQAAGRAMKGEDNPLIQTPWEKARGLSLVVNFYYPASAQARGPLAPWEESKELEFIGQIKMGAAVLQADRVRMYRLKNIPS